MDSSQKIIAEAVDAGSDRNITISLIEKAAKALEELDKARDNFEK